MANIAAVDPPLFPPASIRRCRRLKDVRVFDPSGSRRNLLADTLDTVAGEVLVVDAISPPLTVGTDDDIDAALKAYGASRSTCVPGASVDGEREERAYWLRNTLRESKYGKIRYAIALRRRTTSSTSISVRESSCDWEVTNVKCSVKEMSIEGIRRKRGLLAEDPIKEIAALQYMANCSCQDGASIEIETDCAFRHMKESNVATPLDVIMDDDDIFTIRPYCDGELFDMLECRDHFTESEARHWMSQILNGLQYLHNTANICHRDLRPETLLLHNESNSIMIVDFGVCLRLPAKAQGTDTRPLISPQGICGSLHFEAPEVASNSSFDGEKVDLFAVGVILFVMVTGFAPWERPHFSDERFRYMSGGYLAQMLNEWELGLSPELMDLLQAMLWLDPNDRLSLEQVQNHAWMKLEG